MLGPGEGDDRICVTSTAICTSEDQVAKVAESLARVVTGLALEGININIGFIRVEPETPLGPYGPLQ